MTTKMSKEELEAISAQTRSNDENEDEDDEKGDPLVETIVDRYLDLDEVEKYALMAGVQSPDDLELITAEDLKDMGL